MSAAGSIRVFVRTALGCSCPDEVFRSIEDRPARRINSFITLQRSFVIGNRLLIYVLGAGSAGCLEEHLPVVLAAGRKERDERGLNRFRLVVVADEPEKVRRTAERLFGELHGGDEKVHLHVISATEMPFDAA